MSYTRKKLPRAWRRAQTSAGNTLIFKRDLEPESVAALFAARADVAAIQMPSGYALRGDVVRRCVQG